MTVFAGDLRDGEVKLLRTERCGKCGCLLGVHHEWCRVSDGAFAVSCLACHKDCNPPEETGQRYDRRFADHPSYREMRERAATSRATAIGLALALVLFVIITTIVSLR